MDNFEFNLNQEEWLDVTPREELLQHEINMLKEELTTRRNELEEAELATDLLKGHKELLEKERSNLRSELKKQGEALTGVEGTLNNVLKREAALKNELSQEQVSAKNRSSYLEDSLYSRQEQLQKLQEERDSLKAELQRQSTALNNATGNVGHLMAREKAFRNELAQVKKQSEDRAKDLQASITESKKETAHANSRVMNMERLIQKQKVEHKAELEKSSKTVTSYASMVEDMKQKIRLMEENAQKQKQALAASEQKVKEALTSRADLEKTLANERAAFAKRSTELQGARTDTGKIAIFAEELKEKNRTLGRTLNEQRQEALRSRESLDEVVKRESALKEQIANVQETSQKRIQELESSLAEARTEIEELTKQVGNPDALKESLAREEELREQLNKAKKSSERRLQELRDILGVEFGVEASKQKQQQPRSASSSSKPTLEVPFPFGVRLTW